MSDALIEPSTRDDHGNERHEESSLRIELSPEESQVSNSFAKRKEALQNNDGCEEIKDRHAFTRIGRVFGDNPCRCEATLA